MDLENEFVGEQEDEAEAELNFEIEATMEQETVPESEPLGEIEVEGETEDTEGVDDSTAEVIETTVAPPVPPPTFGGLSLKEQLQAGEFGGKFRPGVGLHGLFKSGAIGGLGSYGSSFGFAGGFEEPKIAKRGKLNKIGTPQEEKVEEKPEPTVVVKHVYVDQRGNPV